ncbi:hypothetical protein [Alkalihalobacterium sp. APHAB7]|uniref:hypothetical protein n=1 Tax=Alkalihalobacterium sp. APHAB7 TaxID=3402081 RepID=UPI003AB09CBE
MVEYARNFFIAVFLGCVLLGLFIVGTSSTNAQSTIEVSTVINEQPAETEYLLLEQKH